MFYRRDFKKYRAFMLQQREEETEARISDINVNLEALAEVLRRRFPTFYQAKS